MAISSLSPLAAQAPAPSPAAQAPAAVPATPIPPTEALRPALDGIREVIAEVNVGKWKAPGEVRGVTQRDIDSMQRDLSETLPPLLDSAKAQPMVVASAFAVYRNIDALYDVLLRVTETAILAAPQSDAARLQARLTGLESARRDLGDAILLAASGQERELADLRAAAAEAAAQAAAAAAVKPAPPTQTIIDDGPAATPKTTAARHKKKPVPTPPAATPPATPQ